MNELIKIISQTNDLMRITVEICKYFNNSCLVVNSNYQVISIQLLIILMMKFFIVLLKDMK